MIKNKTMQTKMKPTNEPGRGEQPLTKFQELLSGCIDGVLGTCHNGALGPTATFTHLVVAIVSDMV